MSVALCLVVNDIDVFEAFKLGVGAGLVKLHLVLAVVVHVEDVDDAVGTSHEIRVVCVDIGILDLYEVFDHRICRLQLLVEQRIHDFNDLFAKILEALKFRHFDLCHHSAELFVD